MALPQVNITITKGALGRVASVNDGIAALLLTGTKTKSASTSDKLYSKANRVFSIADLTTLGITKDAYADAQKQVQDFYNAAGTGAELWVQLLPKDTSFAEVFNADGIAEKLRLPAAGRINVLGVSHGELSGSTLKAATGGLRGGVQAAVPLAQAFALRQQEQSQPLQVILAGNEATLGDLEDYKGGTNTHVSLLIGGSEAGSKVAALGTTLGTLVSLPVQRSLARVKNGALPISEGTFTDGSNVEEKADQYASLHEKRYLFFRTYTGLSGYYIADDSTLAAPSDDLSTIARGRTISKAMRLTYITYAEEIAEEIFVESDGKLAPANVKYLESKLENVLDQNMTNVGEISNVAAYIDPNQNVLSTDKLEVELRIVPVGYTKTISVKIGFTNPQTT